MKIKVTMYLFYFQKLTVWNLSQKLIKDIYLATSDFPAEEKFNLTSQIKRAATSVSTNIAEGVSRKSGKDQARYTDISFGSLMELLSLLNTSVELSFLNKAEYLELQNKIESIARQLNALRRTQRGRDNKY